MTDRPDWRKLLQWLERTSAEEIDCDQFLARAAGLAELLRDAGRLPADAAPALQHLTVCPECEEEFEALRRAVQAEAGDDTSDGIARNPGEPE